MQGRVQEIASMKLLIVFSLWSCNSVLFSISVGDNMHGVLLTRKGHPSMGVQFLLRLHSVHVVDCPRG